MELLEATTDLLAAWVSPENQMSMGLVRLFAGSWGMLEPLKMPLAAWAASGGECAVMIAWTALGARSTLVVVVVVCSC